MTRLKTWNHASGIELLELLLRGGSLHDDVPIEILDTEWALIQSASARLRRSGPLTKHRVLREAKQRAAEFDVLRRGNPPRDHVARIKDPGFRGTREHLVRILAHDSSNAWNSWRKRARIRRPDLRGADLSDRDLGGADLSGARLQGAHLEAAVARFGGFRGADLRGAHCRFADFSYASFDDGDLRDAHLEETLLTGASLRSADLRRAMMLGTYMNRADLRDADLREAAVWGVSAWNVVVGDTTRQEGMHLVSADMADEAEITDLRRELRKPGASVRVDSIEAVNLISDFIHNPKIASMIDGVTGQVVLLLGRFTSDDDAGHPPVLPHLKDALSDERYVPVIFDFPTPESRDTAEMIAILAGLARFVIADLTDPRSAALEAQLIIPTYAMPFVPIVHRDEEPFAMFEALQQRYPWVLETVRYGSARQLVRNLRKWVLDPAEEKFREQTLKKLAAAGSAPP